MRIIKQEQKFEFEKGLLNYANKAKSKKLIENQKLQKKYDIILIEW